MKNIRLNTLMLVVLGLLTQGLSVKASANRGRAPWGWRTLAPEKTTSGWWNSLGGWLDSLRGTSGQARKVWTPSASGAFAPTSSIPEYVQAGSNPLSSANVVTAPSLLPVSDIIGSNVGSAVTESLSPLVSDVSSNVGSAVTENLSQQAAQPAGWFSSGWNRPSLEAIKGYIPSGETVRALPGRALGGATTRLSYPGRAVMSGVSGIRSGASWLAGKAADYIPETVSSNFGQYAGQASQSLSNTRVAQIFNSMSPEQQQAAVGLAAIIGAGIAARQGYNWWRGPTQFAELKRSIQENIGDNLVTFTINPSREVEQAIVDNSNGLKNLIAQKLNQGLLSESEVNSLLNELAKLQIQRVLIGDINVKIDSIAIDVEEGINLNEITKQGGVTNRLGNMIERQYASGALTQEQREILINKLGLLQENALVKLKLAENN